MREKGWTVRKGKGLQSSFVYMREKTMKGVEGIDYFIGEDAFARRYILTNGTMDRRPNLNIADDAGVSADDVSPSSNNASANVDDAHAVSASADNASSSRDAIESAFITEQFGSDEDSICTPPLAQLSPEITPLPNLSLSQFSQLPEPEREPSTSNQLLSGIVIPSTFHGLSQISVDSHPEGLTQLLMSQDSHQLSVLVDAASSMGESGQSDSENEYGTPNEYDTPNNDYHPTLPTYDDVEDAETDDNHADSISYNVDDVNAMDDNDDFEAYDSEDGSEIFDDDEEGNVCDVLDVDGDVEDSSDLNVLDENFVEFLGGQIRLESGNIDTNALRSMEWTAPSNQYDDPDVIAYQGLTNNPGGPIPLFDTLFESPIDLLYRFFPKKLWLSIARETNRYERQTRSERAAKLFAKYQRRRRTSDNNSPNSIAIIKARMRTTPPIEAWEIVRCVGLLIANTLCNHLRGIYHNWSKTTSGALPPGSYGHFMARNRFTHILRMLHFTNNASRGCTRDKAWKIRNVVNVLQKTFRSSWTLTPFLSFDEGVLPSTSRRNTTRMYMPDKPHRWGTKLFMTCDAESCYCFRWVLHFFCPDQHVAYCIMPSTNERVCSTCNMIMQHTRDSNSNMLHQQHVYQHSELEFFTCCY